jgi:SAM-dependent methyltransferase
VHDASEILRAYVERSDVLIEEPDEVLVGDGSFRAIGAEFAGHLLEIAGMRPDDCVVDIGCGQGRTAIPLTQIMTDEGRYYGVDVLRDGIEWCNRKVAPLHSGFSFHHLDVWHPIYNPAGNLSPTSTPVPVEDEIADLVCLISVFTHLDAEMAVHYLKEIRRILKPGGRCLGTFFLITEADKAAQSAAPDRRYLFDLDQPGPTFSPSGDTVLGAVAYQLDWFLEVLKSSELRIDPSPHFGFWRSEDPSQGASFQDICLLSRDDAPN